MTENTIQTLVSTRLRVVRDVNQGVLSVTTGAQILGITRQGLWKLRKSVERYGSSAVTGRKRGPKTYHRVYNRVPEWIEDTVERFFNLYGVGADRICWLLEDCNIYISRATAYRILVRRSIILISAVDDHSRWGMAECYFGNDSLNAAMFLKKIIQEAPFPIKCVRTDNGSEFKKHFSALCKRLGIEIKRNPVKHPTSNGKVERLHRTIEEECFWRVQAHREDLSYARYWLNRYLAWYNTKRAHGGYGMKGRTPQKAVEDWILSNNHNQLSDVNETLILYKS